MSDSATPQTVAHQAHLSMVFSRQEYWSGLPCPSPGDLPNPEIEPVSLVSPSLQTDSLPTELPWKPIKWMKQIRLFSDSFEKAALSSDSQ